MASKRIIDLTTDTSPTAADFTVTVDVSDTTDATDGSSKKVGIDALQAPLIAPATNVTIPTNGSTVVAGGSYTIASGNSLTIGSGGNLKILT